MNYYADNFNLIPPPPPPLVPWVSPRQRNENVNFPLYLILLHAIPWYRRFVGLWVAFTRGSERRASIKPRDRHVLDDAFQVRHEQRNRYESIGTTCTAMQLPKNG